MPSCCQPLAARELSIHCVATSPATEQHARELGIDVGPFEGVDRLDIAIDGADQVTPDGWLVKGGGGAHFREKIVAAAADRFVVIGDSEQAGREAVAAGAARAVASSASRRPCGRSARSSCAMRPTSPDGGLIADYRGPVR